MATARVGTIQTLPSRPIPCLPDRRIRLVGQTAILRRLSCKRQRGILDKRRAPSMNASQHRRELLPFLRPDLAPKPILAGHSYDCEGSELSVPCAAFVS